MRPVAVVQTGPEVDLPRLGPTRSTIAPVGQRHLTCLRQIRCPLWMDLVTRVESPEMGDMAVLVLGVVLVFQPLL